MKEFVEINDVCDVMLKFIGSEDYERILSVIDDNKRAGFMCGMSFLSTMINLKCTKYHSEESRKEPMKVAGHPIKITDNSTGHCPMCALTLKKKHNESFCGHCGQAVKWE